MDALQRGGAGAAEEAAGACGIAAAFGAALAFGSAEACVGGAKKRSFSFW